MKNNHTYIHFDYGGYCSEEHEWISNNPLYGILLKTSSLREITYSVLVDKIYKKIAIDETTVKLKLSYSLSKAQRESYIINDEDVYVFLTSVDSDGLRPVLHVELLNYLIEYYRVEKNSRIEPRSSVSVNYEKLDSNGRGDDVENGGIRQMVRVRSKRFSECVGSGNSVSNGCYDDACSVGSCSPISRDVDSCSRYADSSKEAFLDAERTLGGNIH